jgi:aryl carrier-like protein
MGANPQKPQHPAMLYHCVGAQVAEAVDAMADDSVRFRLFSVNLRQAKHELTSRALAARHALQRWVQEQWHASNTALIAG